MTELKPCPFCGGKASLYLTHLYGAVARYEVECPYCRIKRWSPIGLADDNECMEMRKQEAVEAWNRRANDNN